MSEIYLMPDENNVFHQVELIEWEPGKECEALNKAYKKGQDDKFKELTVNHVFMTKEQLKQVLDAAKKTERKEVIEQVKNVLGCYEHDCENCFYHNGNTCRFFELK